MRVDDTKAQGILSLGFFVRAGVSRSVSPRWTWQYRLRSDAV